MCTWAGIGSLTTCPCIHENQEICRNRKIHQEGQEDQEGVIQLWELLGNEPYDHVSTRHPVSLYVIPSGHSFSFELSSSVIYLLGVLTLFLDSNR